MARTRYPLPEVTNPTGFICVQVLVPDEPGHRQAFAGALYNLTRWYSWQQDADKRAKDAAYRWHEVYDAAMLQLDERTGCGDDQCFSFPPSASFIEWFPNDPYRTPDLVGDGYIFPAWYIANTASNILFGTQTGDAITSIERFPPGSLPTIIPASGLPRFRINVNGMGTVEIHLVNMLAGSIAQITVDDDPNPFAARFVDVLRDVVSAPPETQDIIIIEIDITEPGAHHIDVIIIGQVNDQIPYLFHGGGLRKVVLCGFEAMVDMANPVFRFTEECGMEVSYNGVDYEAVPGWAENFPSCLPVFEMPALSFDQDGFDLILNGDDVELARFDAEELVGKARTWLSWSAADCSLKFAWGDAAMVAIPLAEWMWVDNWYSGGHPAIFNCLPETPPIPVLGNRCNITYWSSAYIKTMLDGFAELVLDGNTGSLSPFEIVQSIITFFQTNGTPGGLAWWFVNFTAISDEATGISDLIELGLMRDMFTDGGFLALWQEAVFCGTPETGDLPDTWLDDMATNALAFLAPTYGSAAEKFAALIPSILSLSDLRTRALLWELNDDHSLDCGEFDCEVEPSPPINLVVCGGYEGSIEVITDALNDGTTGHYKAILGWYDTSVPDTAMHICIAATGAGEEPDQCFIIENIVVTLGPEPDGYKATGVGTGFTDCDFVDHDSPDIHDTENVEAVTVRWSHSSETAIEIEFDLRLVV